MNVLPAIGLLALGAATCSGAVIAPDVQAYLTTKWRQDSGDPATGLNGPELRAELEKLMPQWEREGSWTMAKAKAFCFLCDRTAIDGVDYSEAVKRAERMTVDGFDIKVISLDDLIVNKRASGRPKDVADALSLERIREKCNG